MKGLTKCSFNTMLWYIKQEKGQHWQKKCTRERSINYSLKVIKREREKEHRLTCLLGYFIASSITKEKVADLHLSFKKQRRKEKPSFLFSIVELSLIIFNIIEY